MTWHRHIWRVRHWPDLRRAFALLATLVLLIVALDLLPVTRPGHEKRRVTTYFLSTSKNDRGLSWITPQPGVPIFGEGLLETTDRAAQITVGGMLWELIRIQLFPFDIRREVELRITFRESDMPPRIIADAERAAAFEDLTRIGRGLFGAFPDAEWKQTPFAPPEWVSVRPETSYWNAAGTVIVLCGWGVKLGMIVLFCRSARYAWRERRNLCWRCAFALDGSRRSRCLDCGAEQWTEDAGTCDSPSSSADSDTRPPH